MTISKASTSEIIEIIKVAEKSYRNYIKTIEDSKEFLKQLYDGLSSSYDDLSRETNVNIELMDKILASASQFQDQLESPDFLASFKSCFSSPPHLFMEEKMKAKRKQFAEAQKVLEIFLKGRCEDILKVRSVLQSITSSSKADVNKSSQQATSITSSSSPAPEVKESSQPTPPVTIKTELNDKLKPKFGPMEVQSKALRYSAVIITNVIHPGHLYVQVVDKDVPLYHQMQIELQKEFSSATNQSDSYCSSPTFGRVYALQLEGIWYRVLVENYLVFYVDSGLREVLQPEMCFHFLPTRFFQLKAQAVKCSLFGVVPISTDRTSMYPKGIDSTLRKYVGAHAVAIFRELKSGTVGSSKYLKGVAEGSKELCALITLYVNGASESVNTEVSRTDVARIMDNRKLELPTHPEMRRKALLEAEQWSLLIEKNAKQSRPIKSSNQKRFKPKYGQLELKNRSVNHSSVLITHVIHPYHLYVQIVDRQFPMYHQMMKDLKQEFSESTTYSASYCPSPVVGEAYALQSGNLWYRVILERHLFSTPLVFYVDLGRCESITPDMVFHHLSEKFMQLEAQAVKCTLYGISGPHGEKKEFQSMRHYIGSRAVAIIKGLKAGKVGSGKEAGGVKELCAFVILYADGASESINQELVQTGLAQSNNKDLKIDVPEHQEICQKALLEAEQWILPYKTGTSSINREDKEELLKRETVLVDENEKKPLDAVVSHQLVRSEADGTSISSSTAVSIEEDLKLDKFEEDEGDLDAFSVTFIGARSPDDLFFRTLELAETFFKIQNALFMYFDGHHKESVMDESISCDVGFICAVQSDGRWYRAEVVDVENHPDVLVSLLDKDLSIMVHAGQIRRLPEELTDTPRTMLHCSLSGVYPASGSTGWSPEVTQHIIGRLKGAKQISIGCQKNPDDDEANSTLPVTVYVGECDPLAEITGLTSLNEELISLGLAAASWEPLGQP